MPIRKLGSQCFIKVSCPPLPQTLKGCSETRLAPLKWDSGEGMFSPLTGAIAGSKPHAHSSPLPAPTPLEGCGQRGEALDMALLWLGFKWPPRQKADTLPSWAKGEDGQEVVGKAGSSIEAFIRSRGFPSVLSKSFGHTVNVPRSNLLVYLTAPRTLGFSAESLLSPLPAWSLAI